MSCKKYIFTYIVEIQYEDEHDRPLHRVVGIIIIIIIYYSLYCRRSRPVQRRNDNNNYFTRVVCTKR